jgi:hypothetical protein
MQVVAAHTNTSAEPQSYTTHQAFEKVVASKQSAHANVNVIAAHEPQSYATHHAFVKVVASKQLAPFFLSCLIE